MNKETIIFIDTEDMEERYAEGLYMDYLKEENKQLRDRIDKAIEIAKANHGSCMWCESVEEILKGGNNEC